MTTSAPDGAQETGPQAAALFARWAATEALPDASGVLRLTASTMLRGKSPLALLWGPELRLVYNDAYAPILGSKHPRAYGQPFREVWSEVWPELEPLFARVFGGEAVQDSSRSYLLARRAGAPEQVWVDFSCIPLGRDGGPVEGALVILAERTEEKHLEASLRQSEQRMRAMADAMPQMVWSASGSGHWDYYNEKWQEFTGRPLEQMGPDAWLSLVHPEDREAAVLAWSRSVQSSAPLEMQWRMLHRSGDWRWVLVRADASGTDGTGQRWYGTCTDIHEQRLVLAELHDAHLRLRGAMEATEIGTWVWDVRHDTVHADANSASLFEIGTAATASTETFFGVIHADDIGRVRAALAHTLEGAGTYQDEYRVRSARLGWRHLHVRGKVERDASGRPEWMAGVVLDVTAQRRAEQALRENDIRKNQFLAMLAHELRNPLAPITMGAAVLHRVKSDPGKVEHFADVIARQAGHMSALVDDLMDLSRMSRGKFEVDSQPVAIGTVIRQADEQVRPRAEQKNQVLALFVQQPDALVEGDPRRLVQVVVNLLHNAVKFTPAGGRIDLQALADDRHVRVLVRDTGQGMDPELLQSAFELFKQGETDMNRSHGGLGIGLALVKSLVEMHRGRVAAASAGPGQGSEFEVTLPRHPG